VKVLAIFAVESEFTPWLRRRDFDRLPGSDFPEYENLDGDLQIRIAGAGVGPKRAQRVAREALRWEPDVCIAAGFVGGLKPAYRAGDVLVALSVREGETLRSFTSEPRIASLAEESGARCIGTLCTSAYVISASEDKRRMGRIADAVDMESFFILNEAQELGISGVAIRAVSDAVDEDLPMDFTQVLDERGRVRILRLAGKIVRSPRRIPALIRLGSASRRGARNLATVLDKTIARLGPEQGFLGQHALEKASA
jgi:adenosylhomocysteine nucleosidase